jgi:hypothetical protein
MGTMSIHGLDRDTERFVRAESKRTGLSLNQTLKRLLGQAASKTPRARGASSDDFDDLFGAWTQAEVKEFQKATAEFRRVHPEDWR